MAEHNDLIVGRVTQKCRGVRFYSFAGVNLPFGTRVFYQRESTNPHDNNCVAVLVARPDGRLTPLGHVAAEVARWLSPLFLMQFDIRGYAHLY